MGNENRYFSDENKTLSKDELIEVLVCEIESLIGVYEGEFGQDWIVYEEIAHLFGENEK